MKYTILALCLFIALPLRADYSSLTTNERAQVLKALDMAAEYRVLLDSAETRAIEEIVNVSAQDYRIRLLLTIRTNNLYRQIRRDLYITVRQDQSSAIPWLIAAAAGGFVVGVLAAK